MRQDGELSFRKCTNPINHIVFKVHHFGNEPVEARAK